MPGSSLSAVPEEFLLRAEKYLDLVAPKLQSVEETLRANFSSDIQTIDEVGRHILDGGGKRIRPILLLLSSELLGYCGRKDVTYAAVVEFIHTATLVHDDIIDEAAIRRGRSSINHRWGNNVTVLIGDYLYTHAMKMALAEENLDVLNLLSDITIRMIEGEIIALEQNGRADITIEEYFEIAGRKTAALFGASCRIPAFLVDAPPSSSSALFDYGYNLGICFQLIDDLLDVTSSTEVLGKPALSDLKEGKMTLPIILTLPRASDSERRLIERIARDRSFGMSLSGDVLEVVEKYDGVEQTREFARHYAAQAREALSEFPSSPPRDALEWALDFVVQRDR